MKKLKLLFLISLLAFFLPRLSSPAQAQGPVELSGLTIQLWPEYDDPRLLVIIDGRLAVPGSEIRLPLPAEAELNAVASADDSGRLLQNDWTEEESADGGRLLVMTPKNPIFRVEYYTTLPVDGDRRTVQFELPAGFITSAQGTLEVLLPPGSEDIQLTPPVDESDATEGNAHIFQRDLGAIQEQPITQEVSYANPGGVLTASQPPAAPSPQPSATQAPAAPDKSAAKTSLNPWIILLVIAAALLIIGGAVGLWLTREGGEDDEEALIAPGPQKKSRKVSAKPTAGKMDRFCRQCGEEFGPDDRFCRYCGAPRRPL